MSESARDAMLGTLSGAMSRRGIVVVLLIVVFSIIVAAFALRSIRHTARTHVSGMLTQMLDSTYRVMQFWEKEQRQEVESWARSPRLAGLAAKLVDAGRHGSAAMLQAPAQKQLRSLLAPEMRQRGYKGYCLVDSDGVAVAAMRDNGLGSPDLISGMGTQGATAGKTLLQRVFAGKTVLSLPQLYVRPLTTGKGRDTRRGTSMFVASPVRDASGRVFAALAFRIRPDSDFSRLTLVGRSGNSAESYLVSKDGRMLTGSRFNNELQDMGILPAGQNGIPNLRLHDPGKDLLTDPGLPADYRDLPLTQAAGELGRGRSGMNLDGYRDYRGVPVVGAWRWYPDKGYGVVAEMDVAEAYDNFYRTRGVLFGVLLAMIVVFMLMVFLMELHNRRAADVLRSSEGRYRQLFGLIPDAIAVYREDKIAYSNPAAVSMFGASSPDELVGKAVQELVHPDDWRRVAIRINRAMDAGGFEAPEEMQLLRLDGSCFMAELEGRRFADAEGQDAVLLVARDISARKLAEEERERLRIAVEQASEGIFITDAEGLIMYANPAATHITGREHDKLIGKLASEARGGMVGDELSGNIKARLNSGRTWQGEVTVIRPDSSRRTVERHISPVILNDETHYHVCVDRDITEERRQQEQMEHTQRLESLGVLAGGIAHDFNNILAAILGNASLAGKKYGDNEEAVKHVQRIEDAAQRAADLCRQMLAYSGKGRFVVRPVNLSMMLQDITKLLEVSVTKYAQLEMHLDEDLPSVQADATQLQQVLMNLVINASDAIGEQSGKITLRTGHVHLDAGEVEQAYTGELLPAGDYVFLEVGDTGCGMSEETKKKLFDPFYTTKFTGRGLGMSAVLGIVRGHHGAILVKSKQGKGSCFKVLLPVNGEVAGAGAGQQDEGVEWCPTGTVLVVDDESVVRDTATLMLEDMGFTTLAAVDGEDALEVYRRHRDEIALVLLDMTMPRMDGRTCFARLRDMHPEVRVVLSSGYNEQDATTTFADDELAGFVQKPYRLETLRTTLRAALEG